MLFIFFNLDRRYLQKLKLKRDEEAVEASGPGPSFARVALRPDPPSLLVYEHDILLVGTIFVRQIPPWAGRLAVEYKQIFPTQ